MRSGRFFDAVATLEDARARRRVAQRSDLLEQAVLADALQRVGRNEHAQEIALRNLQSVKQSPHLAARYHFVLGNIDRERGHVTTAIEHLQMAANLAGSDLELACWSQLRLMLFIAELNGPQTALARLDEVKRALTRFGDARPFAALHLWLVEAESICGNLDNARRHLKIADSLLSNVEDIWLRGYMAINSCALNIYSADTAEAQRWAEEAISYARKSGHRPTLLAAHANLGNIEFLLGQLSKAEKCFQVALGCCERGSVNEIAILDNIAQIKLQLGNLDECWSVISRLEELIGGNDYAKRRHYNSYALLTKIRLLLREGRKEEALKVAEGIRRLLETIPQTRMKTEAFLLNVETLLANDNPQAAAESLMAVMGPRHQLSPDLFAQMEQMTGQTLASSNAAHLARVHFQRAVHTFGTIGHSIGMERSQRELASIPELVPANDRIASQRSLDRLRALIDLRNRPELFGHEAVSFLEELGCTSAIELAAYVGNERHLIRHVGVVKDSGSAISRSIVVSAKSHRTVTLSYLPIQNPNCGLVAVSFEKVITQILSIAATDSVFNDREIGWTSEEGAVTEQGVVFASDAMRAVLRTVKQIAATDVSVLVTGETGTGKEVIARTIHAHSPRSKMPFLALNCAAVPKDLLESQLFGYKKGAFSGASENYPGIVRSASGGTLFLDEIGELPLDTQAKLLRFLDMNEVHPIGEAHPIKVNVRLVFATNGDLEEAVTQNRFRQDLFYRLNVIPLRIPPLRERREEISVLANVFARRFAMELSKEPIQFTTTAVERLIVYSWPGNVRQLANETRRLAVLKESGALITPNELSAVLQIPERLGTDGDAERSTRVTVAMNQTLKTATTLLESEMIKHALRQVSGHVSTAAAMLGISRKGLYLKRLRLGLIDLNDAITSRSKHDYSQR